MEPQIRFCTAADGTRIGYGVLGEGPPLLVVLSFGNSIDAEWENPTCRQAYERLAQGRQVVVVMRRGFGPSQREVEDLSLVAQASDIAAVVDALGVERVCLWGFSDSVGPCAVYAVENPDRVSRLLLWSAYPKGAEIVEDSTARSWMELMRANPSVARRAIADIVFPQGPVEDQRWHARQWRQSISPEMAARYFGFLVTLDIRPYLPDIKPPTLVLHRRGDRSAPVAVGRAVAAAIPDARFMILDGDTAYAWFGDTSYLDIVKRFMDEGRPKLDVPADASTPIRTLLFTDIEAHTQMMQRLGDAKGREVLREHERLTREALKAHGGAEVKTMGDGFLASFGSAQKALECAIALQKAFALRQAQGDPHGSVEPISVRVGINAGEPIAEEGDLFGHSVIAAARIAAQARGGEIVVADVVRQLVAGKGFIFADRGETELRGFDDPVRLFELRWQQEEPPSL